MKGGVDILQRLLRTSGDKQAMISACAALSIQLQVPMSDPAAAGPALRFPFGIAATGLVRGDGPDRLVVAEALSFLRQSRRG